MSIRVEADFLAETLQPKGMAQYIQSTEKKKKLRTKNTLSGKVIIPIEEKIHPYLSEISKS